MVGKKYPNYPAVHHLIQGKIYLLHNGVHEVLLQFNRIDPFKKARYKYLFYRLADSEPVTTTTGLASTNSLAGFLIREVPKKDLLLYVSWYTHKPFQDLLTNTPHKTRKVSKSSKQISAN